MTLTRTALVALTLLVAGCDASESDVRRLQLVGTYTLAGDGLGAGTGLAYGSRTSAVPDGPFTSLSARGLYDVPGAGDVQLRFDFLTASSKPGRYPIAPVAVEAGVCGDATGGPDDRQAALLMFVGSAFRPCAPSVLGGEVEILSATDTDVRLRFSFVAVPVQPTGLPDTLRASGTFALAPDPDSPRRP